MGVQFAYGTNQYPHDVVLVAEAQKWLAADRRHQVFYVVPNHVKFETEVAVLKELKKQQAQEVIAQTQLQVFSFTRLAWYFLQQTGFYQPETLTDSGAHMLVHALLRENAAELQLFKGEIGKPGFVEKLVQLFKEFQQSQCQIEDLEAFCHETATTRQRSEMNRKMTEILKLYDAFLRVVAQKEWGARPVLQVLNEYLQMQDLHHVKFIISGFSRFSAVEQALLETVMTQGEVLLDLVLDKPYPKQEPSKIDLFYATGKVYTHFYQWARANKIPVSFDLVLASHIEAVQVPALQQVEALWRNRAVDPQKAAAGVQLWQADSAYGEMRHVATEIRRLVLEENYRYQDIEILSRQLEQDWPVLQAVFAMQEIPYYVNHEFPMRQHPLVEFIEVLFRVYHRRYRYADVMRLLRTEFFMPLAEETEDVAAWLAQRKAWRQKVDVTENVLLAYGYEGYYWTQEADWHYLHYAFMSEEEQEASEDFQIQAISNEVRRFVRERLEPFFANLEQAHTGQEAMLYLYEFMLANGLDRHLQFLREQARASGSLEQARLHEQTWQGLMQVVDEYVTIFGEASYDSQECAELLLTGLAGLTIGKTPATLDRVTVSDFDLVHATKKKVTFLTGFTDQNYPKKIENSTLLTDEERTAFQATAPAGVFLEETGQSLAREPFVVYLGLTSASEKLYVSYPVQQDHVKETKASPYFTRLQRGLGLTSIQKRSVPALAELANYQTFVSTKRVLLSDLLHLNRQAQENQQQLPTAFKQLRAFLEQDATYQKQTTKLFASLEAKNIPTRLDQEVVDALYGQTIHASVSKIESFHQCQYKYFLTYGLKLKEREEFSLNAQATGEFFHEALDQLFKTLVAEKQLLTTMTSEQLHQIVDQVLGKVFAEAQFQVLQASNRMNFIRHQLRQTIQRVAWALKEQSRRTGLSTVATEIQFGQIALQKGIEGLTIDLGKQKQMKIRGKIDRLDEIELNETSYLAIIDYKSSAHQFDYRDAYYGIAMQMLTYLDVALRNAVQLVGKTAKPAGALYLHVQNPLLSEAANSVEAWEQAMLKEFQYKGLLVEEPAILEGLDPTLEPKGRSVVYPVQQNKDGMTSSRQSIKETDLKALMAQNHANFEAAGQAIFEGDVQLNPAYRDKQRIACQTCPFRSVCQFDVLLPENNYHRFEALDAQAVIDRIEAKEGGQPDGDNSTQTEQ